jgi:hypothetical protein
MANVQVDERQKESQFNRLFSIQACNRRRFAVVDARYYCDPGVSGRTAVQVDRNECVRLRVCMNVL